MMAQPNSTATRSSSEATSSSSSSSSPPSPSSSSIPPPSSSSSFSSSVAAPAEEPTPSNPREPIGSSSGGGGGGGGSSSGSQESITVERRGPHYATCRWAISNFPRVKARALWSRYFDVGGYDCRLLVYPKGDSQALPGYCSLYLQLVDPASASKYDCFASYRLSIINPSDESKSVHRDSWHRFSPKKKSHGWCDFSPSGPLLDLKSGFLLPPDSSSPSSATLLIAADILILDESVSFTNEPPPSDALAGKFTWKVRNFSLFKEMIKTQKVMSPVFPAGECNLRISVYQSSVNGTDYLSMCLESKDTEKSPAGPDRSCWCLFRMSVLNQRAGLNHMQRDSYGRFAADNKSGDNTSLGWNDYMKMADFVGQDGGFLVDDTAVFSVSFHVIKESNNFSKNVGAVAGRVGLRKSDGHMGKFTWRIENFTRLKDLLKKRKITGLCIKSRRFQIGNRDCRLIVYPRGQSQPPCHLSVFLEVTDSRNTNDWSCFVSHRLSVVNQKLDEKSVSKESQNRYSKAAKDWGWREFVTLTSLFDQDSGFLVQDTVVFSAEVLILKETSIIQGFTDQELESGNLGSLMDKAGKKGSFTWKVENFLSFKEIMETRKIFSKFFQAGGCELRIGVYESFDTICIYLESDQSVGNDPDKNFWVRYRMAVVNQKSPTKTVWKESSICTKTWNNSVLQFMKVSDMLEADAGFLVRDTVVFVCEILDCCPWFEFSDLEVFASEDDQDALSTDPDELIDSDDSEGISGDEEEIFRNLLARAGFHLTYGDNSSQPQVTLREKLLMDAGAIAGFLTGLRVYLDDPAKVKRLLLPTKLSSINGGKKEAIRSDANSPSLMNLLMGVKVLQQAIVDLLLDIMVECCYPSEGRARDDSSDSSDMSSKSFTDNDEATVPQSSGQNSALDLTECDLSQRLDTGVAESINALAVQSSDANETMVPEKAVPGQPISPPETSAAGLSTDDSSTRASKAKCPEQSEELLGLIVNSLRALDGAVPQGCPEPRRRPQSAQKIALVLDKAPKHLQPDLVALVPKLVDHSEHPLAASALLDRLQKPDAEPSLRLPVLDALGQLEFGSEMWEHVLFQAFKLLTDSNDEPLASTMNFVFKAASRCHHLPEAVRTVRTRLKCLGSQVSPCVWDTLSKTLSSQLDVAQAMLKDFGSVSELDKNCTKTCGFCRSDVNGLSSEATCRVEDDVVSTGHHHISDIFILIEILSVSSLAVEAAQVFERFIAQRIIEAQSLRMVLEWRHSSRLHISCRSLADNPQNMDILADGKLSGSFPVQEDDFAPILGLAEALASSRDSVVQEFVRELYGLLFKMYSDEGCHGRMLKGLIDRATSNTDKFCEVDLDILVFLVHDVGIARPVLSMMREVALLGNVDRAALWHQLCASEDENIRLREEKQNEAMSMAREKAILSERLSESEAITNSLKSEMKAEMDRFSREKKDLSEQIQEVESQLEWLRSERDEETSKLSAEKKVLQDRLNDAEMQLAQLRSRKRDELKRVVKEKNALAERLKNAEAARKRFDEELKRYATEKVSREEDRQSLQDEVRRLKQTVGQKEGEKRENEERIAHYKEYIDELEARLHASQQYIHNLETSLQEEMTRHAPLYGAGLEALSLKELETLASIHEEGLRQVHALQQQKGPANPLVNSHILPQSHSLYPTASGGAVGLPSNILPNGGGVNSNGHMGSPAGPWFKPS